MLPEHDPACASKNELKPWQKKMGSIPPRANAEFVCAMEDVLAVYQRPYDPLHPTVCFDEKSKQLVEEIVKPIPAEPGRIERYGYAYVRNGTANLFMLVEPLRGWRHVDVTAHRTKLDFARRMKERVDIHDPQARRITVVMDNLNTHRLSCLYEAFDPAEARRLIEKIQVVHTPKHGSWLNMAECELSVLARQCLNERIGDETTLRKRVSRWDQAATTAAKKSTGHSKPPTPGSNYDDSTHKFKWNRALGATDIHVHPVMPAASHAKAAKLAAFFS